MHTQRFEANHQHHGNDLHRLLIIDDDDDIRGSLIDFLNTTDLHFDIKSAASISAANKILATFTPDIAIIDIKIGSDSGLTLLSNIKEHNKFCHCIMLTAYHDAEYAVSALHLGADDYYYKPIEPTKLLRDIHSVLDHQSLRIDKLSAQAKFSAAFEQAFQWLFILNINGEVVDINNSAMQALRNHHRQAAAYIGLPLWETPWWKKPVHVQQCIKHAIKQTINNQPYNNQIDIYHEDEGIKSYDLSMRLVIDPSNTLRYIVVECHDITQMKLNEESLQQYRFSLEQKVRERTLEYKLAKQQAEKASNSKTEFLSRMSHELRTPLNAILGFAQLLELDLNENNNSEEQQSNTQEIIEAGHHLLELINEILDLSKIEAGKLDIQMRNLALDEYVAETLTLLDPLAQDQHIQIKNKISAKNRYYIKADPKALKQILINLINNAIKYGRERGRITLSVEQHGHKARISVRDNGAGIPTNRQAKLFMPFERLESHCHLPGSGIGLTICKKLVEEMGGSIGIDSTVGNGSTFWFELDIS